ncbi:hypothetical protein [Stenotrophomonas sp. TWI1183]|uniref:hypothetical protein n=1 Tax=Stenotrophomonas sp. TWI1183 TaxID=3136799 RepID=UPI003207A11E
MSSKSIATAEQGLLPLSLSGLSVPAVIRSDRLPFDATRLSEALKYQVHVAMDYCHTLKPDDVLWIEVFGDVTVEGREQVEVKDYSADLTDGHENLWKTLNNWLNPGFRQESYVSLVLLTTQKFGSRASLKGWKDLDADQRLSALEKIHQDAEKRFAERADSKQGDPALGARLDPSNGKEVRIAESLKLQRRVMASGVRTTLKQVLGKVKLVTEQPDLLGLINRYKTLYLRAILPGRQDEFLDDLFGFMTNARKMTSGWSFTGAQFTSKLIELNKRYSVGNVKFPRLDVGQITMEAQGEHLRERLFVKKLVEIGGDDELVLEATVDLLCAEKIISELLRDLDTSAEDIDDYSGNQLRMHRASRSALLRSSNPALSHAERQQASCSFYDSRCALPADRFGSFDSTPVGFRNGIYHMLADQANLPPLRDFQWRLWE